MDSVSKHRQVLSKLRALIARGYSLRACARKLSKPKSTLHDMLERGEITRLRSDSTARKIRKVNKRRTAVQRHIKDAKFTLTKIARICGVHKSTVSRQSREMLESSPGLSFKPRRVARAKLCSLHGRVTVWPCVACAALAHQGKPQP